MMMLGLCWKVDVVRVEWWVEGDVVRLGWLVVGDY